MGDDIVINDALTIPAHEVWFTTSPSSGPGGQHVNKVETRVTLHFDVGSSPSLAAEQRERVTARLATRIARDGILRLRVQLHRSQAANRAEATRRFAELLREALKPRRRRKKTRKPRSADRRRLEQKRQRGALKRGRSRDFSED